MQAKRIISGAKISAAKRAKFRAQDRAAGRALARGTFRATRKLSLPGMPLPSYFVPGIRMKEHVRLHHHGTVQFAALTAANQPEVIAINATSPFACLNALNLHAGQVVNPTTGHTTLGNQPLYFDQWANLYYNYKVLNCRIKIRCLPLDTNCVQVVLVPSNNVLSDASADISSMRKRAKTMFFENTPLNKYNSELSMELRPWDIMGVTQLEYMAQDGYGALFSASPSLLPIWNIVCQAMNVTVSVNIAIDVEFDCEFTNPVFSEAQS